MEMTRRSFYMALYFLPAIHVASAHLEPAGEALIHLHATLLSYREKRVHGLLYRQRSAPTIQTLR
jgi:hypothetical protein